LKKGRPDFYKHGVNFSLRSFFCWRLKLMEWYQHSVATDSGQLAVENKRVAARKRVLKTRYIVISDKAPKLECTRQECF
jgi:hypothetical protein